MKSESSISGPLEFWASSNGGTYCQSETSLTFVGRNATGKQLAFKLYHLFSKHFRFAVESAWQVVRYHTPNAPEHSPEAVCNVVCTIANCAFGLQDCKDDYDFDGQWHPEQIRCPMRHVCRYNGYVTGGIAPRHSICNPVYTLNLSEADKQLAHYLAHTSMTPAEIAVATGRSEKTIYNHATQVYAAAHVKGRTELTNLLRDLRVA